MKKFFLIIPFVFAYFLGLSQLKVFSNGDVAVISTGTTPTSYLDLAIHDGTRNILQTGSYGIQSLNDENGFLTHNCYYTTGIGPRMKLRTAGAGAMAQFFQGRVIYRTILPGAAGTSQLWVDGLTIQNNGNTQIGYSWTNPQAEKFAVDGLISSMGTVVTSDKRLKSNVSKFESSIDAVMALEPIKYQYNGKGGITDKSYHVGLFAQDLQKVAPEMIIESKYQPVKVIDEMGGVIENAGPVETYLKIKDSEIKYLLLNAIKDQQKLIQQQAKRIENLEEKMENMSRNDDLGNIIEVSLNNYDFAELKENRPNPFVDYTEIDYVVPSGSKSAEIKIFTSFGRELKNISIDHIGMGTIKLNAADIPAGNYSYSLFIDNKLVKTNKMVLIK